MSHLLLHSRGLGWDDSIGGKRREIDKISV
jgi:hypothetical protein